MIEKHKAKTIRGISKKAWIEFEELRKYLKLNQGDAFEKVIEVAQKQIAGAKSISEIRYERVAELEEQVFNLDSMVHSLQSELLKQRALAEEFVKVAEKRFEEIKERADKHSKRIQAINTEIENIKKPKSLTQKMGLGV
ncbi:hypothetical protein [Acidovorax sp. JHL-3]|uniref:hypothetical protein n=1 Tax=Acidovorax sp. JHL-3 TaxID=1276755 RepID=UPI0004659EF6|nr:hypothetical protein [Acidovorax sp. JHL-3]